MNIFQKVWFNVRVGFASFFAKHSYPKAAVEILVPPKVDFNKVFTEAKRDFTNSAKSAFKGVLGVLTPALIITGVVIILILVFYKKFTKVLT